MAVGHEQEVIDVEYTNQRGDLCAVESFTGLGYRRFEET